MGLRRVSSLVSWLIGLLLLAAATLKVQGLGIEPIGPVGIFSAPTFQVALIEIEFLVGLWLLSGKYPIGSWVVTLVLFAAFGAVSFHQGWVGRASCGCFGVVPVNPWHAFVIDLAAVIVLLFGRPDLSPMRHRPRLHLGRTGMMVGGFVVGVTALLGLLAGAATYWYGSPDAALASLRGEHLSVRPQLIDLGEGAAGEGHEALVELVNRTGRPIRIVGGTSDCSCITTGDLPVTIPPWGRTSIRVWGKMSGVAGRFTRTVTLITEEGGFGEARFRLTGRSTGPPEDQHSESKQ